MRPIFRIILPVGVLLFAGAATTYMIETKPVIAPTDLREHVWTVAASTVKVADLTPRLALYGQIVAGRETELRALVAGLIIATGANFAEGGTVRKDDLLIAIDPFDYQATLDERRAGLAEAQARQAEVRARRRSEQEALTQDEAQLALTMRDLKRSLRLRKQGTVSEKRLDDSRLAESRQMQVVSIRQNNLAAISAQLTQQASIIERLAVGLRRARRDLRRTRLTAPFDGYLLDKAAEIGKRLSLNDRIVRLIDAGRLEARVQVSGDQFGRLTTGRGVAGRKAKLIWRAGARIFEYDAVVARTGARINAASGGVELYLRIVGAGLDQPLRPGAFVEVTLADRFYAKVARLDENALHGDTVYVVKAGRLQARKVEVVGRVASDVLLRGDLVSGDQVVTTRFAEIGPGLRVEVR
jgi:RND family efflux transporter MFP subunit